MTQSQTLNLKTALLVAAIALSLGLDRTRDVELACETSCTSAPQPILVKEPGIVAQDRFQGKDT